MADEFTAALEARGLSGPLGKFNGGRLRTDVDDETFNAWLRLCAEKDVKSAELLRDLVYLVVHGKTPAEMTAEDRRELLQGKGPIAARIGGHS